MLFVLIVEDLFVVVNVMLYLMSIVNPPPSCATKLSARTVVKLCTLDSKLSLSLFSFYIAGMSWPAEPVTWIFYTAWPSGLKISDLEQKVNTYLTGMSQLLWENSLLISAPKSSITLFIPDPAQTNIPAQRSR